MHRSLAHQPRRRLRRHRLQTRSERECESDLSRYRQAIGIMCNHLPKAQIVIIFPLALTLPGRPATAFPVIVRRRQGEARQERECSTAPAVRLRAPVPRPDCHFFRSLTHSPSPSFFPPPLLPVTLCRKWLVVRRTRCEQRSPSACSTLTRSWELAFTSIHKAFCL